MAEGNGKSIKDLTSESFGLVIAFLLPGLVGIIALSFWSSSIKGVLKAFLSEKANVNLFLLVIIAALAVGLLITALRALIFEKWFRVTEPLSANDFAALVSSEKFAAFRGAVDAHYRYHQCWGGLVIVLPVLYIGWLKETYTILMFWDSSVFIFPTLCFIVFEVASAWAACEAYKNYVNRARAILKTQKENVMPNGWIIQIEGGSVSVEFDRAKFQQDSSNPNRYFNLTSKLTKVEVKDEQGNILYSSEFPNGMAVITIHGK
jgi:hypothetical protein